MNVKDCAIDYLRQAFISESWGNTGEDIFPLIRHGRLANKRPYVVVVGRAHTVVFHQVDVPVPVNSAEVIAKELSTPLDGLAYLTKFVDYATLESLLARVQ